MILSDRSMRFAQVDGHFKVEPFDERALQPASYECRLGPDFWFPQASSVPISIVRAERERAALAGYKPPGRLESPKNGRTYLHPKQFCLARTLERVEIGPYLVAQVNGKSTLGRLGLLVHCTAGFIDPGFRGTITLELFNAGEYVLELVAGAPICQLVFTQLKCPPDRLYGSDKLDSHYQDQRDVQPAR